MISALDLINNVNTNKWKAFVVCNDKCFSEYSPEEEEANIYIRLYNDNVLEISLFHGYVEKVTIINRTFDDVVCDVRASNDYILHKKIYKESPYDGDMSSNDLIEIIALLVM